MIERPAGTDAEGPHRDAPKSIGPYRLVEVIGEGGMGVVWLAEQVEPVRRQVALKIVRRELDSDEVIARFAAERQAVALMSHPSIAQVYDAGRTDDGVPYFVMEHVPGLPLTDFCDRRELPLRERLLLFVDVCRGVHHAHQKGIVHRDLKPSNVLVALVDGRPVPKIIDFGVAKAMQPLMDAPALAERGRFIGTPSHVSPEQADPTALGVDSRTDVYSLGVLLYELLVGELPFDPKRLSDSELAELPRLIRERTPSRPSTRMRTANETTARRAAARGAGSAVLARRLRGDLDAITMKALQKDPERRYASASELGNDVERHLANLPVMAGPQTAAYRLRKLLARNRWALLSGAVLVLSLIVGLLFSVSQYRDAQRNAALARENQALAERRASEAAALLARAQSAEADAQAALAGESAARREADGRRLAAQSLALSGESPTLALLLAIEGAARAPGQESTAALLRGLEQHHELAAWEGHDGPAMTGAISADGRLVVSGDVTGLLVVHDAVTGAIRARLDEHRAQIRDCGFLRDGESVWSVDHDGVAIVWKTDAPPERAVALRWSCGGSIERAVLAAGGALLCTADEDGVVRAWRVPAAALDSGAVAAPVPTVLATHGPGPVSMTCSYDGGRFASLGMDFVAQVQELPMREDASRPPPVRIELTRDHAPFPEFYNSRLLLRPDVQLSADGTKLLARSMDGQLTLFDAATGEERRRFAGPGDYVGYAGLSPDGSRVFLSRGPPGGSAVAEIHDAATGRTLVTLSSDERWGSARFSRDGRTLLTSQNQHTAWNVATGKRRARLLGAAHWEYAPAFFADGQRVVSFGQDGRVRVFGLSAMRESWSLAELYARGGIDVETVSNDGDLAILERRDTEPASFDLVDAPSGRRLLELLPPTPGPVVCRLSPRADLALLTHSHGTRVWDLTERRVLWERATGSATGAAFSGDSARLLVREPERWIVYEARTGRTVATLARAAAAGGFDVALSPNGDRVAVAGGADNSAAVWDVATDAQLLRIQHRGWCFAAAFDRSGERLATVANDTTVRISDARTGQRMHQMTVPALGWAGLEWSPDGGTIALRMEVEARLFDASTGATRMSCAFGKQGEGDVGGFGARFTSDGEGLLLWRNDHALRLVPLDLSALARRVAPRTLTAAEMETYGIGTAEERAAARQRREDALCSMIALTQYARSVLDAGDLDHALQLLERAAPLRKRPLPEYSFLLARASMQRAGRAAGAEARAADEARALAALADAAQSGELTRAKLTLTPEFAPLQGRAEFDKLLAMAKP